MAERLMMKKDGLYFNQHRLAEIRYDDDETLNVVSARAVANAVRSAQAALAMIEFEDEEAHKTFERAISLANAVRRSNLARVWTDEDRQLRREKRKYESRAREEVRAGGDERSGTSQEPPV